MIAALDDRALARVGGEDAATFLQGLVTCDVERLGSGGAAFGALLSPQGKIQFDFFVTRLGDGFLFDVARPMRDDFIRRLNFYKLRAKVATAAEDGLAIHAAWGGPCEAAGGIAIADPRLAEMGTRVYSARAPQGEAGDYEVHRISLGMPEGGKDFVYGDCFPHEALMDQFGGVDFAKGCYVGQEVVSRMQHRGTARTRIVMVEAEASLPAFNTDILAGGRPAGTMGSSAGRLGLARLRLDRVSEALAAGALVTAGSLVVTVRLQPWVRFGWPRE
ncbi:MAG: folate-binding protein [Alphaproteobacteria bacterium]|nr:MAG: folate-binding protein [Alphaproteobacteria bacterium]